MIQKHSMEDVKRRVLEIMKFLSEKAPTAPQATPYIANLVKQNFGYERTEVEQAVNFLCDDGYLKKEKDGGIDRYRLSSQGHQEFTPTKYTKTSLSSTIINHQTGGISITGSGNSIGQITQTTINNINDLDKVIKLVEASNMEENKKRDTILNTETLKNELAKSSPDRSVLERVWNKIVENAKTVSDAMEIIRVLSLIYPVVKTFVPHLPELPTLNGNISNLA